MSDMGVTVGAANVRIMPNTKNFAASLKKFLDRMEKTNRLNIGMDLDSSGFASEVRRAVTAAQEAAGNVDVDATVNSSGMVSEARRAVAAAQAAAGDIDVKMRVDRNSLARLSGAALSGLGGFVSSIGRMTALAGTATVAVAGLVPVIAAVGSAAAAAIGPMVALGAAMAPAVIGSAAAAIGVLKASFNGFGEALKAEDLASFEQAISTMPASAQEGARALYGLKQSFADVGQEIQGNFWSNFSNIGDLAKLVEPIRSAMSGLAMDMGNAAAGLVGFVTQGTGLSAMKTLIDGSSTAASSLSYAFADVLRGIIAVGASAAPIFADLSAKVADLASAWADKMVAGFQDGSLQQYFAGVVSNVQSLMGFLGQVGTIISSVFSAASAAGMPFLGMIGALVTQMEQFVTSAQGMDMMTNFFTQMGAAVSTVAPILGQIASILVGTVAPAIAGFITAIGPGLSAVIDGLGQGLAAIAPAVAPLGEALGQVLAAAAPLLPVLGQIAGAIGAALAPAISALAPVISSIVATFQALSPVITTIATVLGTVLTAAITALAPLFDMLAQAAQLLAPVMMQIATTIGGLLVQAFTMLAPYIPMIAAAFMQILQAVMPLVPIILQLATTLIGALMPVIAALMPVIVALISIFANVVSALAPVIAIVLQVVSVFAQLLATIVSFVASALGMILSFVAGVIAGFVSMVGTVIGTVAGWVSSIIGFFANLASSAMSAVTSMWSSVVSAFSSGVSQAISFVASMPGRARAALGNVGGLLVSSGRALIQGFIDGIRQMIGAVADAARSAVQAAKNFFPHSPAKEGPFSGRGWVLYSGQSVGEAFAQGITDRISDAAAASKDMMGAAAGNLNGYRANVGALAGAGGFGPGVDYSVHIGTVVAADPEKPIKDAQEMQLKARIKGGVA